MFNSYARAYNNLSISATSGTLIKSHPKSFTKTYQVNSELSGILNNTTPTLWFQRTREHRECVIIQTMILGEQWLMSEIVWLDDYLESEGE